MAKYKQSGKQSFIMKEPEATYSTRLRAIGNSKGVILNAEILNKAGLDTNQDILIQAAKGAIVIVQDKKEEQELASWDKQFREAKKKGNIPEKDLFWGMTNKFDREEW